MTSTAKKTARATAAESYVINRSRTVGVVTLTLALPGELKDLLGTAANDRGVSMNEIVAAVLAKEFKRPDLAAIPRKTPGRKRKASQGASLAS